jgi:hypothetical protein
VKSTVLQSRIAIFFFIVLSFLLFTPFGFFSIFPREIDITNNSYSYYIRCIPYSTANIQINPEKSKENGEKKRAGLKSGPLEREFISYREDYSSASASSQLVHMGMDSL